MAERKPPGVSRESWIDRQIREAQERGEFDDLPGKGKPLPDIDKPRDELWWVKQLLRREDLSVTPRTLGLRKQVEDAYRQAAEARSEPEVRRIVAAINEQIRDVNTRATSGPPSRVAPLDEEEVLRGWRLRGR